MGRDFVPMKKKLQDQVDLKALRAAKAEEADAPTVSLAEARKELGLKKRAPAPSRRR